MTTNRKDIKTALGRSPFADMDQQVKGVYRKYLRNFRDLMVAACESKPDGDDSVIIEEVSLQMEAMARVVLHMICWMNRVDAKSVGKSDMGYAGILAYVHLISIVEGIDRLFPGEIQRITYRDRREGP